MGLWRKVKGTIILAFSLFGALKKLKIGFLKGKHLSTS